MSDIPLRLSAKCISATALIYSTVTTDAIGIFAGTVCQNCATLGKPFKRDSSCETCGATTALRMASTSKHQSLWSCPASMREGTHCLHELVEDEPESDAQGCNGYTHGKYVHWNMMQQIQTLGKALWTNISTTLMASAGVRTYQDTVTRPFQGNK